MPNLFENPIQSKKVRAGVIAYKYQNGVINIQGTKYFFCSMTEAIKKFRKDNPIKN